MASFLLLSKGIRRMRPPRRLCPYGPFLGYVDWGSHELDPARGIGTTEETNTARSKAMEKMTDTLKESIKDTAKAVKRGAEKSKKAAVRTAEQVKDTTDRAVEKVKDA